MGDKSGSRHPGLKRASTVSSSSSSSEYGLLSYSTEEATKHENLYVCLLCCSAFTKPKLLDCQHIFCEPCLVDYCEEAATTINCPTCFMFTSLGPKGITGLKSSDDNPIIQRKVSVLSDGGGMQRCDVCIYKRNIEEAHYFCPKCGINLCTACKDVHDQQQIYQKHQCVSIGSTDTIVFLCDAHYKMAALWWCTDCQGTSLCNVCILLRHQGHQVDKLQYVLSLKRDKIKSMLKKLEPLLDHTEMVLDATKSKGMHKFKQGSLEKRASFIDGFPATSPANDDRKTTMMKLSRYNRFFNFALKMVDKSQSKRLIATYGDVLSRIHTIIGQELDDIPELKGTKVEDKIKDPTMKSIDMCDSAAMCTPQPKLLFKPELIWKIEKHTRDAGELWNPCAVTFLPDGCTIVAEYDIINDKNNRLRVFSATGTPVSTIGKEIIRPLGVTVSKEGRIYATDCENKRVKIFNICGAVIGELGKGQFGWPYGVAVNSRGQVIVSDAFSDTISIFGGDGKRMKQFGGSGSANNQLRSPFHVTVDGKDNIYVADSGNHKVKVFNAEGCFLRESASKASRFGSSGESKKNKVKSPRGVAIDMVENLLVTDDHSRVALFNQETMFEQNLLEYKDCVRYPEAVAANNEGKLAITEWNPNQMFAVKVYNMYG